MRILLNFKSLLCCFCLVLLVMAEDGLGASATPTPWTADGICTDEIGGLRLLRASLIGASELVYDIKPTDFPRGNQATIANFSDRLNNFLKSYATGKERSETPDIWEQAYIFGGDYPPEAMKKQLTYYKVKMGIATVDALATSATATNDKATKDWLDTIKKITSWATGVVGMAGDPVLLSISAMAVKDMQSLNDNEAPLPTIHAPTPGRRHYGMAVAGKPNGISTILLAFAGSQSWEGVWTYMDTDMDYRPLTYAEEKVPTGNTRLRDFMSIGGADPQKLTANQGVTKLALNFQPEVYDSLSKILKFLNGEDKPTSPVEVILTGHGLGGGVANIFRALLNQWFKEQGIAHNINLITFGSPRVFKYDAAQSFESQIDR